MSIRRTRTGCSLRRLGHPYGPNPERGIFRSTDGGANFEKVLYKDEYTSGNDVRIDPSNPNIVYAALWQQQQGFYENGAFGGTDGGIFKSTDGGSNWKKLTGGLPPIMQANLAIAPSNPAVIYATVAAGGPAAASSCCTGTRGRSRPRTSRRTRRQHLLLQNHRRRRTLDRWPRMIPACMKQDRRPASAGYAAAGSHRRRRPAHDHSGSEERKSRL